MASVEFPTVGSDRRWSQLGLLALSASQGGAYLGFGLQYALLTPFVLELGVPKQWASIIWLGGPITGMIVQPLIGRLSDGRSGGLGCLAPLVARFGRRRPYLGLGAVCLLLAQLLVGNSADLGHSMGDALTATLKIRSVCLFTLGFWLLDASNNALWVVSKSLTADVVPEAQWPQAFSVSTAATGLGLALGYVAGGVRWTARPGFSWLQTEACNTAGGCSDLRFAFLVASFVCVLANGCTIAIAQEEPRRTPPAGDVHTPLVANQERSVAATLRIVRGNQALVATYSVTLLAWLGWISLQIYQTEFIATEVYQGSADETSPANKAYVSGVHAASRALILNAVLMTGATYLIPVALRKLGKSWLWSLSTGLTALMLAASQLVGRFHAKAAASAWLALLGPLYSVQQTIPFLVVSEEAPKDLLGELNGFLNVALCIPQLLISLFGGWAVAVAGTDTLLFTAGAICDVLASFVCLRLLA